MQGSGLFLPINWQVGSTYQLWFTTIRGTASPGHIGRGMASQSNNLLKTLDTMKSLEYGARLLYVNHSTSQGLFSSLNKVLKLPSEYR